MRLQFFWAGPPKKILAPCSSTGIGCNNSLDLEEAMKAAVKSPNQVLFLTGVFPSGKRGYFAVDLTQE